MALTKADIVDHLIYKLHLEPLHAREFVEIFFEEIKQNLEQGEEVKLSGFGNFVVREKSERPGRNPKTGEVVAVKARRVVTFKPGVKLRARVETVDINH